MPRIIEVPGSRDNRGSFSKPFSAHFEHQESFKIREIFWSTNNKGALRGMHFQIPEMQMNKLVWVSTGSIIDVLVDLNAGPNFGVVSSFALSGETNLALWVPKGYAHGFQALEDHTIVNYATDQDYSPNHDKGILWSSINFDWPLNPTEISTRDNNFPALADFETPFKGSKGL